MKKFIQITLIVLAIASTIDAKVMRKRAASLSTQAESSARQISEATDALKDAVKDIQSAPAEEKVMARQEANDAVANLLATLHERTWSGDLRGYSKEQIKAAGEKLELLYAEDKNLETQIKAQLLKIDEMKDKSFWGLWSSVKEERAEEHKETLTELRKLQSKHAKVKSAIHSEEVVAGKAYALSIKRAVYVIGAAAAVGIAYAIDTYGFDSKGKAYLSELFKNRGGFSGAIARGEAKGVVTTPFAKSTDLEALQREEQKAIHSKIVNRKPWRPTTIEEQNEIFRKEAEKATRKPWRSPVFTLEEETPAVQRQLPSEKVNIREYYQQKQLEKQLKANQKKQPHI